MGEKKAAVQVAKFSKPQIIAAKRYSGQRDLLIALLCENKMYSHADVQAEIAKFKKGKV